MKYIDASTIESLKHGVMEFLGFSEDEMNQVFETIDSLDDQEPYEWVEDFLNTCVSEEETIECFQMFHLARRLQGTDLKVNQNLEQLLTKKSAISDFFSKYDINFKQKDNHIVILYKGKEQILDDRVSSNSMVNYLCSRLGYYKEKDYCVNGFAFRDHLEKNFYFKFLCKGPELIQNIESFFNIQGMSKDYCENSRYYCIEYLIPLSEVIFDGNCKLVSKRDKMLEFLKIAILRLYDFWKGCDFVCDENLMFRLADNAEVNPEWFVNAEEILNE